MYAIINKIIYIISLNREIANNILYNERTVEYMKIEFT